MAQSISVNGVPSSASVGTPKVHYAGSAVVVAPKAVENTVFTAPQVILVNSGKTVVAPLALVNSSIPAPVARADSADTIRMAVAIVNSSALVPGILTARPAKVLQVTGISSAQGVGSIHVGATYSSPITVTVPVVVANVGAPGSGVVRTEADVAGGSACVSNTSALAPTLHVRRAATVVSALAIENTLVAVPTVKHDRLAVIKPTAAVESTKIAPVTYVTSASRSVLVAAPVAIGSAEAESPAVHFRVGVHLVSALANETTSVRPPTVVLARRFVGRPAPTVVRSSAPSPLVGTRRGVAGTTAVISLENTSARAPIVKTARADLLTAAPSTTSNPVRSPIVGKAKTKQIATPAALRYTAAYPGILVLSTLGVHVHAPRAIETAAAQHIGLSTTQRSVVHPAPSDNTTAAPVPAVVCSRGVYLSAPPAKETGGMATRVYVGGFRRTRFMGPTRTVTMSYVAKEDDY